MYNPPAQLEVGSLDKIQFIQWNPDALQHGLDNLLVVLHPELQQLPGSLHVVQVGMQVRKQDGHLRKTNGGKEESVCNKLPVSVKMISHHTHTHTHPKYKQDSRSTRSTSLLTSQPALRKSAILDMGTK